MDRTKRSKSLKNFPPSPTEQEHAPHMTMSAIAKQLERGVNFKHTPNAIYSTDLGLRNLQDVYEFTRQTKELFDQLPSEIKKLANNDPLQFEEMINNTQNHDTLKKYDFFVEKGKESTKLYQMSEDQFQALLASKQPNPSNPTGGTTKTDSKGV